MTKISQITALEILDSRGRPTIKAYCQLEDGRKGAASVPSGASTGVHEALELRDGDQSHFNGLGVLKAVDNINGKINRALTGSTFAFQSDLDQQLIDLDGTENKSQLGANAMLAVSIAFARTQAANIPLYDHFASLIGHPLHSLPRPTINLFSGGKHGGMQIPLQDLLVVPAQDTMIDCFNATYKVYQSAAELCKEKYGMRALSADEGGLAPPFPDLKTLFDDAMKSIENAGLKPGEDMHIALDVAASHFYKDGKYSLGPQHLSSQELIEEIASWCSLYPIVSVEDGLAEDDWDHWPSLVKMISPKSLVLGDDLLCTNPARIQRAIDTESASALLLKVNQIGTLTEAAEAYKLARQAGWHVTVSARSGETEDDWLADLATGWQGNQIKIGSITQSERLAKYNRLLEIEKETGLPINNWPNQ